MDKKNNFRRLSRNKLLNNQRRNRLTREQIVNRIKKEREAREIAEREADIKRREAAVNSSNQTRLNRIRERLVKNEQPTNPDDLVFLRSNYEKTYQRFKKQWKEQAQPHKSGDSAPKTAKELISAQRNYETMLLIENDYDGKTEASRQAAFAKIMDTHTTVGIEWEFAKHNNPDIGAHQKIAESKEGILESVSGGGFVLETDSDQKLEMVLPPILIERPVDMGTLKKIYDTFRDSIDTARNSIKPSENINKLKGELEKELGVTIPKQKDAPDLLLESNTLSNPKDINKGGYGQINMAMTSDEFIKYSKEILKLDLARPDYNPEYRLGHDVYRNIKALESFKVLELSDGINHVLAMELSKMMAIPSILEQKQVTGQNKAELNKKKEELNLKIYENTIEIQKLNKKSKDALLKGEEIDVSEDIASFEQKNSILTREKEVIESALGELNDPLDMHSSIKEHFGVWVKDNPVSILKNVLTNKESDAEIIKGLKGNEEFKTAIKEEIVRTIKEKVEEGSPVYKQDYIDIMNQEIDAFLENISKEEVSLKNTSVEFGKEQFGNGYGVRKDTFVNIPSGENTQLHLVEVRSDWAIRKMEEL